MGSGVGSTAQPSKNSSEYGNHCHRARHAAKAVDGAVRGGAQVLVAVGAPDQEARRERQGDLSRDGEGAVVAEERCGERGVEAMQQAAKRLSSRPKLGHQRFVRGAPEEFAKTCEPIWTATLFDLLTCYGDIRSTDEADTLTIAATRLFSVEEAAKRLRNLIGSSPEWTVLRQFLPAGLQSPMDVRSATASHFVASLELAREGFLKLRQDNHFAPLYMKLRNS